ncbi:MAG: hypothetical protein WBV62_04135, partial [Roseobacter sp.]
MTVFPKKSEQKRLDSSAQTGGHQPQIPINPTFENRSSAQVVRQVREPPYCLPQRVDQSAVQRQYAEEGILLGECRFISSGLSSWSWRSSILSFESTTVLVAS